MSTMALEGDIEDAVLKILRAIIGEDTDRKGLLDTPARVARMYSELTVGYTLDLDTVVNGALFDADNYDEIIIVRNIDFFSLCEHHMVPFHGRAHVGYIPDKHGHVIGLSKIPRIVEMYAKRLQIQERLTVQIAHAIWDVTNPTGVGVVMEAQHLCCAMRGVKKPSARMKTSCMRGVFKDDENARREFLELIRS